MQICGSTAVGLLVSLMVARGITFFIFAVGILCLISAFLLAYKNKTAASSLTLLCSMSAMLLTLAITGAGMFDLAILGYPGIFIFAAILGGVGLFLSVLGFVIAQCTLIVWLTMHGYISPNAPTLSWSHLIFVVVIFVIIGFSVYVLVQDIKALMASLQVENNKVQQSRSQIQHLAYHDPLTNLPNRRLGEKLFNEQLAQTIQNNHHLAILFIDLDNFKPVNDALGHAAGDLLLQQLTYRLSSGLPQEQKIVRFGGDEFLVIAPSKHDDELDNLARKLIHDCSVAFEIKKNKISVTASIGIVKAPEHGTNFKQLCRKADIAMYAAKRAGRNTFRYYDHRLDEISEARFTLLQRLRNAVENQEFTLYYQPIIDIKQHKLDCVEALLRWPQPDGSMISPEEFIPLAETGGLINDIGIWVINQACRFCARMRAEGAVDLRIAVNLSSTQFKDNEILSTIKQALTHSGLPATALEIELTESLLIEDTDNIQQQLDAISALGVTIAIDDFGTGYSNLGYLRNFNANHLKIDKSFITHLGHNTLDDALVSAMIKMANSLGLKTIAEGIEDTATLRKLIELGCDGGQGYLWSKPVSPEALTDLLSSDYLNIAHKDSA